MRPITLLLTLFGLALSSACQSEAQTFHADTSPRADSSSSLSRSYYLSRQPYDGSERPYDGSKQSYYASERPYYVCDGTNGNEAYPRVDTAAPVRATKSAAETDGCHECCPATCPCPCPSSKQPKVDWLCELAAFLRRCRCGLAGSGFGTP